jgi:hypothetical protein
LVYLLLLGFFLILGRFHIIFTFEGPFHKHAADVGVVTFEEFFGDFYIVSSMCKQLFCLVPLLVHMVGLTFADLTQFESYQSFTHILASRLVLIFDHHLVERVPLQMTSHQALNLAAHCL